MADEKAGVTRRFDSRRSSEHIIGRLKDHGPANYQFRAKEDPSYYMKLITSRRERILAIRMQSL